MVTSELLPVEFKDLHRQHRSNIEMIQNLVVIWLDKNIDDKNEDCHNTITQLQHAVSLINRFTDEEECIKFLESVRNETTCMITSGSLGHYIVPQIHQMPQVNSIFIFCGNKKFHQQWTCDWFKIKGIYTEINPICDAVKGIVQQCEQNSIPISFIVTDSGISNQNLKQLDPAFIYMQILKGILLNMKFNEQHIIEFIQYCRNMLRNNEKQLNNVKLLECQYRSEISFRWYTRESFLYSMVNRALRVLDSNIIIKLGFFLHDLHHQIDELHKQQFGNDKSDTILTLYRGQGMNKDNFTKMMKTKGGLLSFNCFSCANQNRDVSLGFANDALTNPDLIGVLFVMSVDPRQSTVPFAFINDITDSKYKHGEILFSMQTVFRIGEIKSIDENQRLFQVNLTLINDDDKDLCALTNLIRKEVEESTGWNQLSDLLLKIGQSEKAQQIYEILLEQAIDELETARIYYKIGCAKDALGKYNEALTLYEKALGIQKQMLPSIHLDLAKTYNCIGVVSYNMANYSKALSSYENALEIWQQALPSNHSYVASSYNNIGLVYSSIGEYPKAISSHEKALELRQQTLPLNHPHFASSYNNLGLLYSNMGQYAEALSFHEKALELKQQTLPSTHPDFAMSYNNIGLVYFNMGEYSKALSYYEKALVIKQQTLPSNHPDLATCYNNIGNVYYSMGDYSKGLFYYEKALEIRRQTLPSHHPDLASAYNNIALVYSKTGEYAKALSFHEKALQIKQQSLPPNHPDLIMAYTNMANVYERMAEYPKALSYYEKVLEIKQQSLPSNHPDLAISYGCIGNMHYNMGEYSKALPFCERAVHLAEQSLPSDHPHLQWYKNNLNIVKQNL